MGLVCIEVANANALIAPSNGKRIETIQPLLERGERNGFRLWHAKETHKSLSAIGAQRKRPHRVSTHGVQKERRRSNFRCRRQTCVTMTSQHCADQTDRWVGSSMAR